MADSYEWQPSDKTRGVKAPRNPLSEMPEIDLKDITPVVFGSMDTPECYDLAFGDIWVDGLNEQQALMLLKKVRSQYMVELNKLQKEIDRLAIFDMPSDDPRVHTPWPRRYELRVKKEKR